MNEKENQQQAGQPTEEQIRIANKINDVTERKMGRLFMENVRLTTQVDVEKEEKLMLAQYVQQLENQIREYEAMLNIQNGSAQAAENEERTEDLKNVMAKANAEAKPNREQRRAAAKGK